MVTIIEPDGTEREYDANESPFAVEVGNRTLRPVVCDSIEVESNEQSDTTGTLCGDQRTQNTSKDPFRVTVTGIVTNSNLPDELNVENLLYDIHEGDELFIESDYPIESALRVSNVLVRQEADLHKVAAPLTNEVPRKAFRFQIQFGEEDNQ